MTSNIQEPCICQETACSVIDLTPWFVTPHATSTNDDTDVSHSQQRHSTTNKDAANVNKDICNDLLQNLRRSGWSLVSIDARRLSTSFTSDNDFDSTICSPPSWPELIRAMFENEQIQQAKATSCESLTFRSFESGASGATAVEPKWSWEMTTANATKTLKAIHNEGTTTDNRTNLVERRMAAWTKLLYAVSSSVRRALQLPENLLLEEEAHTTTGSSCMDLLRAFYYHPVSNSNENDDSISTTNAATFGSSPHTDWGSFTVVYQDESIEGLQTYCRVCEKWMNVSSKVPDASNVDAADKLDDDMLPLKSIRFVVHVGDITSLAIQHATMLQQQSSDGTYVASHADDPAAGRTCFPSPLHRVLAPTGSEPRVSLVYFAYPPANRSMSEIAGELVKWIANVADDAVSAVATDAAVSIQSISYHDYYLLRNQSAAAANIDAKATDPNVSARCEFHRIIDQPVGEILDQKWMQVQR